MYTGADTGLSVGCISTDKVRGEGEAFNAGLPDQRPAGERAGYQGKNNTHTIQSSRHQRARKRQEVIESEEGWGWGVESNEEGEGGQRELDLSAETFFSPLYIFCTASQEHVIHREIEHYCNSTETENNIKPSLWKRCFEGNDAVIKTLPKRQCVAEKPLSETRLSDLSFSLSFCLFLLLCFRFSACLCVFGDEKR